jgi:cation diffusion facilitator CzcD-associated flavoprotein CzcO
MATEQAKVVIIGAGPAGLAAGTALKHSGIDSILIERGPSVGTRWYGHYERLHLHTAKRTSALPYFPFPANYPKYPSRQQVIDYLSAYAKHFQLDVRCETAANSARKTDRGWEVETTNGTFEAPYLIVATGFNEVPNLPTWQGQDQFGGNIIHSRYYRSGADYKGQRVLVVGFGNSGAEIALDLCEQGVTTAVSVRNPINVVRRDLYGLPIQQWSIILSYLPPRVADLVNMPSTLRYYGDLHRYGLRKLPYGPATQTRKYQTIPVIDIGTIQKIREGNITVYPGIESFTANGVKFVDGREAAFDVVVLATGYHPDLAPLLGDVSQLVDARGYPLVNGHETALKGLFFCGLQNASGGLLRQIGIEARQIEREISIKEQH